MSGKMELSDGTSSVSFSPLVDPGIRRPENRTRGVHQYDGGARQYWDASGGFREDFSLKNVSKAKADQLNEWWRRLTILQFRQEDIVIFADLNGSTQYFYRSDADFPESGITGDMTIQAWVKVDSVFDFNGIVRKADTAGQNCYIFRFNNDGKLWLYITDDGTDYSYARTDSVIAEADTWIHVAVTYDASEASAIMYKNGAAVPSSHALDNSIFDGTSLFSVGGKGGYVFDGGIAHVAIFDDIRTAGEILASYNDPPEDLSGAGNIIGQWHFDEDGDAAAIDNTQGDAGRDLIPYDGGDVTFGECGRTSQLIYARINPAGSRPFQWMFGQAVDTKYEAVVTIVETSSSSSA